MKRESFFLPIFVPETRLLTWVLSYIVLFLLPHPLLGSDGLLIVMEDMALDEDHEGNLIIAADDITLDCNNHTVSK